MKRHPSLIPLSHDHHLGLLVALILKKDAPAYQGAPKTLPDKIEYLISFHKTHLVPHFEKEEKVLFPFVSGRDEKTDSLLDELKKDHHDLTTMITSLKSKLNQKEELEAIGILLDEHIRKEERILFEKIPQLLSEEELARLDEQMK